MSSKKLFQFMVAAIAIVSSMLLAPSCKKAGPTGPVGPTADFTLDLATTADTALLHPGGAFIKNGIIVVNDNNVYAALYDTCSYAACALAYNTVSPHLICPCHSCQFALDGSVMVGPATVKIKVYTVTKNGSVLHITG